MDLILCGHLIDGTGQPPVKGAYLQIEAGRIVNMGSQSRLPSTGGGDVLDLGKFYVLPGLVDCHDHLGLDMYDEEEQSREPDAWTTIKGVRNARAKLGAGITTLRDMGAKNHVDQWWKKAIDEGHIQGPRLLISGEPLVRTGGHGWFDSEEVDGVDSVRRGVRRQEKAGADWIKVMAGGGCTTPRSVLTRQDLTDEELIATVDEAHRLGLKVATHVHGGPGARAAILAGVDSVEHGTFLTREDLAMMVERGTYLVSTFSVYQASLEPQEVSFAEYSLQMARGVVERHPEMLQLARESGVQIGVGTDGNHTALVDELEALVRAGFEPMETIQIATASAARLCGLGDRVGTLEAGKYADLIAVDGDPLSDLAALRRVEGVVKGGVVEKA